MAVKKRYVSFDKSVLAEAERPSAQRGGIVRERGDAIATSDPDDMRRLLGPRVTILPV